MNRMVNSLRPFGLFLTAAALILGLSMGIRQALGLFIPDMTAATGIGMATFSAAFAVQNLLWGFVSPLGGMLADRVGTGLTLALGTVLYAFGLGLMAFTQT
ncbi:MAG: MFS transporter, partial [Pseudomonadota bacterium]